MAAATGDQIRMARSALRITVREMAEMTGIDKSTIVRVEAGGNVYHATMVKLQTALEAAGAEFLDAIEGQRGPGVAFKWGVDPSKRAPGAGVGNDPEDGGLQARDRDLADFVAGEVWPRISESGQRAIFEAAYGAE